MTNQFEKSINELFPFIVYRGIFSKNVTYNLLRNKNQTKQVKHGIGHLKKKMRIHFNAFKLLTCEWCIHATMNATNQFVANAIKLETN